MGETTNQGRRFQRLKVVLFGAGFIKDSLTFWVKSDVLHNVDSSTK